MEVYEVLILSGNYGLLHPAIMTLCKQAVSTLETSLDKNNYSTVIKLENFSVKTASPHLRF